MIGHDKTPVARSKGAKVSKLTQVTDETKGLASINKLSKLQ